MTRTTRSRADEAALIRTVLLAQAEAAEAFQTLVGPHTTTLRSMLQRMCGTTGIPVDDVLQDALTLAWRRISTFRGDSTFGTWLISIATNCCRMALRTENHRSSSTTYLDDVQHEVACGDTPADELLYRREVTRLIRRAVESLPPAQLATWRYYEQHKEDDAFDELASALGLSTGAFKSRIRRARVRIRRWFVHNAPEVLEGNDFDTALFGGTN